MPNSSIDSETLEYVIKTGGDVKQLCLCTSFGLEDIGVRKLPDSSSIAQNGMIKILFYEAQADL